MHSLCAPKILHNLFFSLLLGITVIPREIENNAYAKFEGGGGGPIRRIRGNALVVYGLYFITDLLGGL